MRAAVCPTSADKEARNISDVKPPPPDRGVVVGVGFSDFRGRLLPLLEQPELHRQCAFRPPTGISAIVVRDLEFHGDAVL